MSPDARLVRLRTHDRELGLARANLRTAEPISRTGAIISMGSSAKFQAERDFSSSGRVKCRTHKWNCREPTKIAVAEVKKLVNRSGEAFHPALGLARSSREVTTDTRRVSVRNNSLPVAPQELSSAASEPTAALRKGQREERYHL